MAVKYILAKDFTEGHRFAREDLGLERGTYRLVSSASAIKGIRGAELHLAPGWERRYDHFAMKAAMRWSRMEIIDHSAGDPVSVLQDDDDEENDEDEKALTDAESEGLAPVISLSTTSASIDDRKRVRRKRCEQCGDLVLPDEVDDHAASHGDA